MKEVYTEKFLHQQSYKEGILHRGSLTLKESYIEGILHLQRLTLMESYIGKSYIEGFLHLREYYSEGVLN